MKILREWSNPKFKGYTILIDNNKYKREAKLNLDGDERVWWGKFKIDGHSSDGQKPNEESGSYYYIKDFTALENRFNRTRKLERIIHG